MRRMSRCLTRFPISGLGEPYIYHDSGVFYKKVGIFDLVVFLVGVCFSGGLLFYSSVPQFYFDIFSYHILFSPPSVPQSYFEDISY